MFGEQTKESILAPIIKTVLGYDIRPYEGESAQQPAERSAGQPATTTEEAVQPGEGGTPVPGNAAGRNVSAREETRVDSQGNPIDENGKLILEKVKSVDELTDDDFTKPTRNVVLPRLPENLSTAIGSEKDVIIKKNIFEKNQRTHSDLSPTDGRTILKDALYSANKYGQTQPVKRPHYWVAVHTGDENRIATLSTPANAPSAPARTKLISSVFFIAKYFLPLFNLQPPTFNLYSSTVFTRYSFPSSGTTTSVSISTGSPELVQTPPIFFCSWSIGL